MNATALVISHLKRTGITTLSFTGLLLLNPFHAKGASDVTVTSSATAGGAFSGTDPKVFTPTAASATADKASVETFLNTPLSVTINTASGAGGNGDITVSAAVAKTAGASSSLTFNAIRDLNLNAALSSSSGTLPLVFTIGRNGTNTQSITTNGGNVTLSPTQTFTVGAAIDAGSGQLLLTSGTIASASAISLTGSTVQFASGTNSRMTGTINGAFTAGGSISPAATGTAGNLQVNGDLTLQGTASTTLEIGGTGQGSEYDHFGSSGAVTVAGSLAVSLTGAFPDSIDNSQVFTVFSGTSISGTFSGQANGSRVTLPNDYGSLRINYNATSITLDDWQPVIVDLTWDPGSADAGSNVFTNSNTRAGRHYFRVTTQATDIGAWRSRLAVTSGEANLYLRKTSLPTTSTFQYSSTRTGADGFVLRSDQFAASEEWFLMVYATTAGSQWNVCSGRAFVQNLGTLGFTDTNLNSQYDIGEPITAGGSGSVAIGPEGMRFFTNTVPTGTPAWSLWLNGDTRDIAVRKNLVPFPSAYDRKQAGQMLVVPTYLGTGSGTYFLSVDGNPGETVNLDSRIQNVQDIAFASTTSNVAVSGPPYRVFRVTVPIDQIAWDVSTTANSGNPNVAVRRNNVPAEFDNDAFSEAPGAAQDSVTLVPDYLTDGTWFITVYGTGSYNFNLVSGNPTVTPMAFNDLKTNDQTTRAGWRFYAVTDIPSQVGTLGWELLLSQQVPGSMIAIRRNKVPGRWNYRQNGDSYSYDTSTQYVDFSGTLGFLQRPGHQADVWYVGIFTPQQPLGAFVLDAHPITPTTLTFDGGPPASVSDLLPGRWTYKRVDVPSTAGIVGWDVRVKNVTGTGAPILVVRRDLLPDSTGNTWYNPSNNTTWPSGYPWVGETDWTNRYLDPDESNQSRRRLVLGMGGPLEPGTYYVGVYDGDAANPTSFTLESRGIGTGQTIPVGTLAFPSGNSMPINSLIPREASYFKVTIPAGTPSWEFTLTPSLGEMMMCVRRGTVPDFHAEENNYYQSLNEPSYLTEVAVQKTGSERFLLLPADNEDYLLAGDYYVAVVSEGQSPANASYVGTGTSSGLLASLGSLSSGSLGAVSTTAINQPISLVGGQVKNYTFTIPANTPSVEVRLDNRTGNPLLHVVSGLRFAKPAFTNNAYGYNSGQISGSVSAYDDNLITLINPAAGSYNLSVYADYVDPGYPAATADLILVAVPPTTVAFDGGTFPVTSQDPGAWHYFHVTVPATAGIMGWDLRVKNVTGLGNPVLIVRRDLLPESVNGNWYGPTSYTSWTSGYSWAGEVDWTGRSLDPDASNQAQRRLLMAMGGPLEPGEYYVGVYNSGGSTNPVSYTLESRGIGTGQTIPVDTLAYTSGSNTSISNLAPRETRYFKVTIPADTPSWEFTLDPSVGEMMMCVRRGTIPDFEAALSNHVLDLNYPGYFVSSSITKTGPERFVMLPSDNADFLLADDYYIAVVSEGQNPSDASHVGTGNASGLLTSQGALGTTNLGTVNEIGTTLPVSLFGGQVKNLSFTVPPGTASLQVRLDNRVNNPVMRVVGGSRLARPSAGYYEYGFNAGQLSGTPSLYDDNLITLTNPVPGVYNVNLRADQIGSPTYEFLSASADLVIIAAPPAEVTFNGGTSAVAGQEGNSWRYFHVTVPSTPGILGWDLRVKDVVGNGNPVLVVRRDLLPQDVSTTSYYPQFELTWPSGNQWVGELDWTGRTYNPGNANPTQRRLVTGMGAPLEPGEYYVGVYNSDGSNPTSYTLESKGIGTGQLIPVDILPFAANSSMPVNSLAPREASYFKVTIPAHTTSWEFTLGTSSGEMMMCVRRGTIPDFRAEDYNYAYSLNYPAYLIESAIQKAGSERFVILPDDNEDFLLAGDYYIAVVGEGQNPANAGQVGTGTSSGTLTSGGPITPVNLGAASLAGTTQAVNLLAAQIKDYTFTVPADTLALELRLDNRVGNPVMRVINGSRIGKPSPNNYNEYGFNSGQTSGVTSVFDDGLITLTNPAPGTYNVSVYAGYVGSPTNDFLDASATLSVRQMPVQTLNFAASQNGNGISHTNTQQLLDTQKAFYQIAVPATLSGQPVLGWILRNSFAQGNATIRVYPTWGNPGSGIQVTSRAAVIVPPFLTPGSTWHVEVEGIGLTNFTLTSEPIGLQRPVYSMPLGHNALFGDTGNDSNGDPLPGDRGIDLGQDDWHFFAVDIPAGNAGLLRTELQAINGNPNLYLREDGVPTTDHSTLGSSGSTLAPRSLTSTGSEYGNWVPWNGRYEKELRAGRWYFGVKATGGTNARYRLLLSNGTVTDLALNGGSASGQNLVGRDWRYYRFTVPLDAPLDWNVTFSQEVGDVVMFLRDTIPPGNAADGLETTDYGQGYPYSLRTWHGDSKNQGPYSYNGHDASGTHTFHTPPLRPGATYYAGFKANSDATFSVSSATAGGTVGNLPVLNFYNGTLNTTVPAQDTLVYRIPAPPEGTRLKWTSTHDSSVEFRLEQGTLPDLTGSQHWTGSGFNIAFNTALDPTFWPWQPARDYYLRVINSSGDPQPLTLVLNGQNAGTEDEDADGLLDAWEVLHFGYLGATDGTSDPDSDGNSNLVEQADGTIPNDPSSALYSLTLSAIHGSASPSPVAIKYAKGTTVTLTGTPDSGYALERWLWQIDRPRDFFVVKATGTVTIPGNGFWTFGTNSAYVVRLKVDGVAIMDESTPDTDGDRFGDVLLTAGTHTLELVSFAYDGDDRLELFAAPGQFTEFDASMKLVGDTAQGGLAVQTTYNSVTSNGFTVRQVADQIGAVGNLTVADQVLNNTQVGRADTSQVHPMVNFLNEGPSGHFASDLALPLSQNDTRNPLTIIMNGNYTILALNSVPLATATDNALVWTTSGDAPWLGENSATSFDGTDQAYPAPLLINQIARMSTTVYGPGTLTFRWKVSSDVNDPLQFLINNALQLGISGEADWDLVTIPIPAGVQTLNWTYYKDADITAGADRGWVDQVSYVPAPGFTTWQVANFTLTELANPAVSGPDANPDGDRLPNILEYAFGTDPHNPVQSQTPTHLPFGHLVTVGPDSYIGLTYVRLIGAPDLTFTPEFSSTPHPGGFSASAFTQVSVTNNGDGTEKVILRDNVPVTPGSPRFVRIYVDLN